MHDQDAGFVHIHIKGMSLTACGTGLCWRVWHNAMIWDKKRIIQWAIRL